MNYNKFQSRKFILAMFVIVLASVELYFKLIDAQSWVTVILADLSGYLVANVWQGKDKE